MIDYKRQMEIIRNVLEECKKDNVSDEETYLSLEANLPIKTVYVEKPPVSSKEKLEYMKLYREEQKQLKKEQDKQKRIDLKIEKAKERTGFYCYKCKQNVKITNPQDNKHNIERKKNDLKKKIIIINQCPNCQAVLRGFGGFLDEK